jgi:hypothetical protein
MGRLCTRAGSCLRVTNSSGSGVLKLVCPKLGQTKSNVTTDQQPCGVQQTPTIFRPPAGQQFVCLVGGREGSWGLYQVGTTSPHGPSRSHLGSSNLDKRVHGGLHNLCEPNSVSGWPCSKLIQRSVSTKLVGTTSPQGNLLTQLG